MVQSNAQSTATVADALDNARRLLPSHPKAAADQARAIIAAEPDIAEAHLILAAAFRSLDRGDEASAAEQQALRVSTADPILARVSELIAADRRGEADHLVRRFLQDTPNDPEAHRLLARILAATGNLQHAEQTLWRVLSLAPGFEQAKQDMDGLVDLQAKAFLREQEKPSSPPEGEAEFGHALQMNEAAIAQQPENPKAWLSYGHVLRISGRHDDSVAAYRKAVDLRPYFGEAWWSLADLKTASINDGDLAVMTQQLGAAQATETDRTGIHFALGQALSDRDRPAEAFGHYAEGNSMKRKSVRYDPDAVADFVRQCEAKFTRQFFEARSGQGHQASDPIFIIGMPRSGSTLVEQILSSHPSIEGTEELIFLGNQASLLAGGRKVGLDPSPFVEALASLAPDRLASIGGAYLWNASRHRRSSRPLFIDKMPRNWLYLPLIKLALPNARIVDVRRHPLDCCWSNYRQLFADSGEYSYDQAELGRYYQSYVRMLAHFDAATPGTVHRLVYEDLVTDPEAEVRRLLDYLGLPFDPACLQFHENRRAVKTSSSEQVRRPISSAGIDQWRDYETWLRPLKDALGPVLPSYPEAPARWE